MNSHSVRGGCGPKGRISSECRESIRFRKFGDGQLVFDAEAMDLLRYIRNMYATLHNELLAVSGNFDITIGVFWSHSKLALAS